MLEGAVVRTEKLMPRASSDKASVARATRG